MKSLLMLVKRNCKLYLKDKASVFFSMLTIMIIIILNMVFLKSVNVDEILKILPEAGDNASYFVNSWVLAGIVITGTVTITLGVFGIMVEDEEKKRMKAFFVAPISRLKLTLGYILSAFILGCLLSITVLIVTQIFVFASGGTLMTLESFLKAILVIVLNVFTNSAIMFFVVSFVKTSNTFSSISVIVGTVIGFISGIYLPIGDLPAAVQKFMKCFPVMHGAAMMRKVYTMDSLNNLFKGVPTEVISDYKEFMGISINISGNQISDLQQSLFLVLCGIIFIALSTIVLKNKHASDR